MARLELAVPLKQPDRNAAPCNVRSSTSSCKFRLAYLPFGRPISRSSSSSKARFLPASQRQITFRIYPRAYAFSLCPLPFTFEVVIFIVLRQPVSGFSISRKYGMPVFMRMSSSEVVMRKAPRPLVPTK